MAGFFADTERVPPAAVLLGAAGAVPFGLAAAAQWLTLPHLPADAAQAAGIVYAAVILSFLGGIRWGTALELRSPRRQTSDFILSVLPALAGWIAVMLPGLLGVSLLIAGFLLQAQWDVVNADRGRLPAWFGRLRMGLTAAAVLSLIAMLVALLI